MTKCVLYTFQLFYSTSVKILCTELDDVNFTYKKSGKFICQTNKLNWWEIYDENLRLPGLYQMW